MTLSTNTARGVAIFLGLAATILVGYVLPRHALAGEIFSLRNGVAIVAVIFLVCGTCLGFVWRDRGWRLGFWIAAGNWLLGGLAMLFEPPPLQVFLANDLPMMVTVIVAACGGGYIGGYLGLSFLKKRSQGP